MSEKMQTFRKLPRTGMHKTVLSEGSVVNGEKLTRRGAVVMRPGNTVTCIEKELGVGGRKQFELTSPPLPSKSEVKQASLVIKERESKGYWDVVNPNNPDQPLNDKALRRTAAEALLDQLLTKGQAKEDSASPYELPDNIGEMDWNDLVAELEQAGLEMKDEFENEDDLRMALRGSVDGLGDLDWDALVEKLEEAEIELLDEWETEDDLRSALRSNVSENEE